MTITDGGDRVTLTVACPCGQVFEMTAHDMELVGVLARASYVARMTRAGVKAVIRHCHMGRATLN